MGISTRCSSGLSRRQFLGSALATGAVAFSPRIARAETSEIPPDLRTPYKFNRLVVAASHQPGAFDSESVDAPFVFRHGRRFYMTYIGFDGQGYQTGLASSHNAKDQPHRWHEQSGFATSKDLKTWVRFEGNPVVRNGGLGSPDERFASDPCVLRYRHEWAIFYYSLDAKGVARDLLALSPNLRDARKCDGYLVDVGSRGSVDSTYAHKPSIISHKGVLYHFYCAVSKEFGRGISVATSHPLQSMF